VEEGVGETWWRFVQYFVGQREMESEN